MNRISTAGIPPRTGLRRPLKTVPDDQREAAITEFREDFAADLARAAEIEAALLDPTTHPELLRPDPAFAEQRGHILAVADLIRADHSVEEAEALVAGKASASPDAAEKTSEN